jgi:Protein of unknown function (DUF1592)/Protein of unknown function (DUF1588)/Protein of unknown function (DUF1595)/Protein of unknown function (DUF1587)/Protein of unknown function (DUF1585)
MSAGIGAAAAALGAVWVAVGCTGQITSPGASPAHPGGAPSGGAGASVTGTGGATTPGMPAPGVESPSPRLLRQLNLAEYTRTVGDLLHLANVDTSAIPPDVSVDGFTTNVTGIFVSDTSIDAYNTTGAALSDRAVAESFAALVPCTTQDTTCAGTFVDAFGQRAFRRPLAADEHARYLALFDASLTGGDFKTGVGLVIKAMLVSPYFLFRSELGVDMGNGTATFQLTPYEIATSLAYSYWGTMPDDALFASAKTGALASKTEIEAQARRLLADPRGRARVASFFYEWMESARAYVATKDGGKYPTFTKANANSAIVSAMRDEEDAFIGNVVFDSTKKWGELFTATYTFANDALAGYYGLPAPGSGTTPKKVTLPAGDQRGGLLTLGMFLVGHGRTDQSSPTQRGHMIRASMLCSDVPPPPADVNTNVTQAPAGQTGRDQIQALTGSGVCNGCHMLMNPIGFGLEGFDSTGAERTLDNGQPVDATGVINGFASKTGAPLTFNGARELSAILADSDDARRCFAGNYHRYARGFAAKGVDAGAVQKFQQTFLTQNLDLPELFVQVALQDSFVLRRSADVVER